MENDPITSGRIQILGYSVADKIYCMGTWLCKPPITVKDSTGKIHRTSTKQNLSKSFTVKILASVVYIDPVWQLVEAI